MWKIGENIFKDNPKLDNYKKALKFLDDAMIKPPANSLERDGIIQRFEYCLEVSWNSAKKVLEYHEFKADTPRNIFRELARIGWINNPEKWIEFLEARNKTSHLYHEKVAEELFESESTFNPNAFANNKKQIGPARGLVQITEQSLKILKDKKGELKDNYVELTKEELFEPSKNICAAIRWLFQKRKILQKRLGRSPQWIETVVEYKGLGRQLRTNGPEAINIMGKFSKFLEKYIC